MPASKESFSRTRVGNRRITSVQTIITPQYGLLCSQQRKGWRRDRDSNPGYPLRYTRFPSVRLQPLGHLSAKEAGLLLVYSTGLPRAKPRRPYAQPNSKRQPALPWEYGIKSPPGTHGGQTHGSRLADCASWFRSVRIDGFFGRAAVAGTKSSSC